MEVTDKPTVIYGLLDPRSGELKYIGKTVQKISTRYDTHVSDAKTGRNRKSSGRWIQQLLNCGTRPEIIELEVVPPGRDWQEAECFWIASMRLAGAGLTNIAHGGGVGALGWRHSEETKRLISQKHKGRAVPDELRARWSSSRRGKKRKPTSEETRRKISEAQRGKPNLSARRPHTAEHNAKISAAHMRKPPISEETRQKYREAQLRRYQDPEQRRLRSESAKKAAARARSKAD